jgi:hypothetical protein
MCTVGVTTSRVMVVGQKTAYGRAGPGGHTPNKPGIEASAIDASAFDHSRPTFSSSGSATENSTYEIASAFDDGFGTPPPIRVVRVSVISSRGTGETDQTCSSNRRTFARSSVPVSPIISEFRKPAG